MNIYVAEINGRGIAARNAEDQFAAKDYFDSSLFRDNLMIFNNEGQPLCAEKIRALKGRELGPPTHPPTCGSDAGLFAIA